MTKKEFEQIRKRILKIYDKKDELNKELDEKLSILKDNCAHDLIIECEYRPETAITYAEPPSRRCLVCGLVERGWGAGYNKLSKDPIKTISREEFFGTINKLPDIKFKMLKTVEFK